MMMLSAVSITFNEAHSICNVMSGYVPTLHELIPELNAANQEEVSYLNDVTIWINAPNESLRASKEKCYMADIDFGSRTVTANVVNCNMQYKYICFHKSNNILNREEEDQTKVTVKNTSRRLVNDVTASPTTNCADVRLYRFCQARSDCYWSQKKCYPKAISSAPTKYPTTSMPTGAPIPAAADSATGGQHNCVLFSSKNIKCFGNNAYGQLGYEDKVNRGDRPNQTGSNLKFVNVGTNVQVDSVIAGLAHTCILAISPKSIKCWGYNESGQLGYGDVENRGDQTGEMGNNLPFVDLGNSKVTIQIALGSRHTCALLSDQTVKCFGFGGDGRLGHGNRDRLGDGPNEMGDLLPVIYFGTNQVVKRIILSAPSYHNCVQLQSDYLKCWGNNEYGQLGYGDTENRGDHPNEMGDHLPLVSVGQNTKVVTTTIGEFHSCALTNTQIVRCWGRNDFGQLGQGHRQNIGDEIREMGEFIPPIGLGSSFYLVQITSGAHHKCVVMNNNKIKCWGWGDYGQLGYGSKAWVGSKPYQMGNYLPFVDMGAPDKITKISAGSFHNCVYFVGNKMKCYGNNGSGRLGYGDFLYRGDSPNEMGSRLPYVNL